MTIRSICAMLAATCAITASARQKGAATKATTGDNAVVILLPDFYHQERPKSGDTTYGYDVYNHKHLRVRVDTVININVIDEIHYIKSYFQRAPRPGEAISPPYLSAQLCNYERMSDTSWLAYNRVTKEKYGLIDHFKTITREEKATVTDPATNATRNIIYRYYKTVKVSADAVPALHEH